MLKWIEKIDYGIEKAERWLAVGLFSILITLICVVVFTRIAGRFVNWNSHFFVELSPTVVLWLALVGATLALKHQRHIKVELLLRFLSPLWRKLAISLTALFAMIICGLLAYASVPFLLDEVGGTGAKGWFVVCFPLFFMVAFFRFSLQLLKQWIMAK